MRICLFALLCLAPVAAGAEARKRARELGIEIGVLTPGPRNAINSLTMAETTSGFRGNRVHGIPLDRLAEIVN